MRLDAKEMGVCAQGMDVWSQVFLRNGELHNEDEARYYDAIDDDIIDDVN